MALDRFALHIIYLYFLWFEEHDMGILFEKKKKMLMFSRGTHLLKDFWLTVGKKIMKYRSLVITSFFSPIKKFAGEKNSKEKV